MEEEDENELKTLQALEHHYSAAGLHEPGTAGSSLGQTTILGADRKNIEKIKVLVDMIKLERLERLKLAE
jgi:hypothetical protein